jgi:hypothetical protein
MMCVLKWKLPVCGWSKINTVFAWTFDTKWVEVHKFCWLQKSLALGNGRLVWWGGYPQNRFDPHRFQCLFKKTSSPLLSSIQIFLRPLGGRPPSSKSISGLSVCLFFSTHNITRMRHRLSQGSVSEKVCTCTCELQNVQVQVFYKSGHRSAVLLSSFLSQ